ncbi:hypothetical protein F5Y10DRAFT_272436 [Nemania abortiva]|nr:hypothetical protein F5Y10DRAFT_272436 [Nemania abortiva]
MAYKKENEFVMGKQPEDEEGEAPRSFMESVLQNALAENQRKDKDVEQTSYPNARLSRARPLTLMQNLMTIDQLLAVVRAVDYIEQRTADFGKVLQLRNKIHPVAEVEAISLFQTTVFRDWLLLGHSDNILIEGTGGTAEFVDHAERVSNKSIMCAVFLSQLIRLEPDSFKIYFFCGLHSSENDTLSDGPRGLMRGLICSLAGEAYRRQLLRLEFIDDTYRDGLQQQKIEYFCQVFHQILQSMSVGALGLPIYCIIDGIGQYEKQEWLGDLAIVMGMFRAIINDTELKPCFKLLLTSPHSVRYVNEMVGLPPSKRLLARPAVIDENLPAQREMQSGADQILPARRLQIMAERSGQSQYQDDQYSIDDYE